MFFRTKTSGTRSYLQIVENRWLDGRPRQRVIATLGVLTVLSQAVVPMPPGTLSSSTSVSVGAPFSLPRMRSGRITRGRSFLSAASRCSATA